jgi:hypothetical protein
MRRIAALLVLAFISDSLARAESPAEGVQISPVVVVQATYVAPQETEHEAEVVDPYEGWESWCEDLRPPPCFTDADCGPDRTGQPTRCVAPPWAKRMKREALTRGEDWADTEGVCAVKLTYEERDRTVARIDAYVREVCKVKPARWYREGRGMTLPRGSCDHEALFALLDAVSGRESSKRRGIVHRLNPDVNACYQAWRRKAEKYAENPHYHTAERWRTYGLYGQISALYLEEWDPDHAPPELLCRQPEQEEMLLRRYRRVWKKQTGGIDCLDAAGNPYSAKLLRAGKQRRDRVVDTVQNPTWSSLHRGANGRLCPSTDDAARELDKRFEARSVQAGLPPYQHVTFEMLGRPLSPDTQDEDAEKLREKVSNLTSDEVKEVMEERMKRASRRRMRICREKPSLRGC